MCLVTSISTDDAVFQQGRIVYMPGGVPHIAIGEDDADMVDLAAGILEKCEVACLAPSIVDRGTTRCLVARIARQLPACHGIDHLRES